MGVFMMIGVPLYALTLGKVASIVGDFSLQQHHLKLLNSPIGEEEFIFACNVLSPAGSDTLVCGEFILLQLMRSGIIDADSVQDLKDRFETLDVDKRGDQFYASIDFSH